MLSINDINSRINQEICHEALKELKDINLMDVYINCNSVKTRIENLGCVLEY